MMAAHVELILIITGLATAGALAIVVAPVPMIRAVFGQAPADPLGLIIARHWALLIFLVGGLIVYAAYRPEIRVPTLIVAVVEKAAFAAAMLTSPFRRRPTVMVIALADAGMAALYLMFLAGL
jgi:hypothetical protein